MSKLKTITLNGRCIVPGKCSGEALVSRKPISFLGGVDPKTGLIVERDHDLKGESIKDKILCFPHGHGSTVGSYVLYSLARRGCAPRAIINERADPVVVVGAVIADVPMMDRVNIQVIRTGDYVEVDCLKGVLRILRE